MSKVISTPASMDIVPRRLDLVPRLPMQRTHHQRFSPTPPPHPAWINHSSQRHIRDIAMDKHRECLWLATWGGILGWEPDRDQCTRHTSEQGLLGNATRRLVVDRKGTVWAAGIDTGLCSLKLDHDPSWKPHQDTYCWQVLCLTPRSEEGVYLALQDKEHRCALAEIASLDAPLSLLKQEGLEVKEIATLFLDKDDKLWLGNAWGLHCWDLHNNTLLESFDLERKQIRVLIASESNGGLWVGTQHGLYHLQPGHDPAYLSEEKWPRNWPRDEVIALSLEPETKHLWVLTASEVGKIINNDTWQPLSKVPPDTLNCLVTTRVQKEIPHPTSASLQKSHVWVGGSQGLYKLNLIDYQLAFTPAKEDSLSNSVQCLHVDAETVWIGTTRGLHCFDSQSWKSYGLKLPDLWDVRAIMPAVNKDRVWIGTWHNGLCRFEQGVYVPGRNTILPIMAMTTATDQTLWAATLNTLHKLPPGSQKWEEPIGSQAPATIPLGIIQSLCYQVINHNARLWVGTSAGLFSYNPDTKLWDPEPAGLKPLPIQALALDPLTNRLWVGTAAGLFSEPDWQCYCENDIRALVFGPPPERTLWVGTATGLERWKLTVQGELAEKTPEASYTIDNSGLAAACVTALAIRVADNVREIWIGSPAGVSCYRYQS
ncbi:MAG: hypothetical protein U1F76_22380 [Candidatus Competibacteraceae bacterium]